MKRIALGVALLLAVYVSGPAAQTMPSVAFSFYAGETAATMQSKYRLKVNVSANAGAAASIPLNLDCTTTAGTCLQQLPVYPNGTVLRITVQTACAATPTLFGPSSPAITWTVGTPLPPPPMPLPPVSDACAAVPPPPPISSNGATVPPSIQIVDSARDVWALSARRVIRNGAHQSEGYGDLILLWGAGSTSMKVYVKNDTYPDENGSWWVFDELQRWAQVAGDPRVPAPPPPPPPNQPPTVSLTAPLNGSVVTAPAAIILRANASDPDGTVKVEFLGGGGTVILVDGEAPYEANHAIPGPGIYSYRARAIDDRGAVTTSSEVVVTAVAPPPPPPPPSTTPAAPVLREAGTSECRFVLRAEKPDATSGWSAQFRRNGVNVSNKDSSAPYERTVRVAPGNYTWDVLWTKSGVTSKTSAAIKTGLTCQAVP